MPKRTASSSSTQSSVAEAIRANTVVLEDMRSQMAMVIEATVTTRKELWSALQAMEERLSARISALEAAVAQNSADIRKNSEDIKELREEVARLRHDFDHREEGARLSSLEVRVTAIERRLGEASR